MSYVFVIDTDKQPLSPVHPGRARLLLKGGKAAVYRRYPFTLILKHKVDKPVPAPLRLKQDIRDFLADQPDRLCHVLTQTKVPLKDATVVNVTRSELLRRLQAIGLSLETGSGGRTKYNRIMRGLPKTHWTDAACVVVGIGGPGGEATLAGFGVSPNAPIPQRVLGSALGEGTCLVILNNW